MIILVCPSPQYKRRISYPLDSTLIGFTSTYPLERYQRLNNRVIGPFLKVPETKRA